MEHEAGEYHRHWGEVSQALPSAGDPCEECSSGLLVSPRHHVPLRPALMGRPSSVRSRAVGEAAGATLRSDNFAPSQENRNWKPARGANPRDERDHASQIRTVCDCSHVRLPPRPGGAPERRERRGRHTSALRRAARSRRWRLKCAAEFAGEASLALAGRGALCVVSDSGKQIQDSVTRRASGLFKGIASHSALCFMPSCCRRWTVMQRGLATRKYESAKAPAPEPAAPLGGRILARSRRRLTPKPSYRYAVSSSAFADARN